MRFTRPIVGAILLGCVLSIGGLLVDGALGRWAAPGMPGAQRRAGQFEASGLSFRADDASGASVIVEVGEAVRSNVRMGPLTLNPVAELSMSDVKIEIRDPTNSEALPLELLRKALEGAAGRGLVKRRNQLTWLITFEPMQIAVRRADGQGFELSASRVTFKPGSRSASLVNGFTVVTPHGQYLVGRGAVLDLDQNTLSIPGRYALRDGEESRSAERGVFAIESSGQLVRQDRSGAG